MQDSFLFLGTGASMGIPVIGCSCSVCKSSLEQNKRLRPSGLLTIGGKRLLIDCGPDFRQQALKFQVDNIDGVLITHAHQDHTGCIDDLRAYYLHFKKSIPCLMSKDTAADLRNHFEYIFNEKPKHPNSVVPKLAVQELTAERGTVDFVGFNVQYMTFIQMGMKVNGFRFGDFAYISDIKEYPETIFEDLKGVKILVVSALRFTPSPFHLSVDEAVDFSKRVGAGKTWLTHISHDLEHLHTNAYLPANIQLAYDGLEISI